MATSEQQHQAPATDATAERNTEPNAESVASEAGGAPVQLQRRTLTLLFVEHTRSDADEAVDMQLEWLAARYHGIRDRLAKADGALVFFAEAVDCVRMAMTLQRSLSPVRLRMGISTASCQIAFFSRGGEAYATLLGAESDLAARVAAGASAGSILISPSTYALVRDAVHADSRDCLLAEELDTHHQPLASITATPTRPGGDLSTFAGLGLC